MFDEAAVLGWVFEHRRPDPAERQVDARHHQQSVRHTLDDVAVGVKVPEK